MPRDPAPQRILTYRAGGALWASGVFAGMALFIQENDIKLVVNLLSKPSWTLPVGCYEVHFNMNDFGDMEFWDAKVGEVVDEICKSLKRDEGVLVHCAHGVHRTGAVISLVLALILCVDDNTRPWLEILRSAWENFASNRKLAGILSNRDLRAESWVATSEYWSKYQKGPMLPHLLSLESVQSLNSVPSRLPLQAKALPAKARLTPRPTKMTLTPWWSATPAAATVRPVRSGVSVEAEVQQDEEEEVFDEQHPEGLTLADIQVMQARSVSEPPAKRPRNSGPFMERDWRCRKCGNHNWSWRGYCNSRHHGVCGDTRDEAFGVGDWYCWCGNWNFYWRTVCNRSKCQRHRSRAQQPGYRGG